MKTRSKIISLMLCLVLTLALAFAITSCNEEPAECTHVDAERDGVCDKCGKPSGVTPCEHADANKDKKCDACGADYTAACTDHVSADADAKCDYCGADIVCTECVDSNSDGACDKCGKAVEANATGSVELVKDGTVKFQFVLANEYKSNSTVVQEVDKLINTIKEKNATVERVADVDTTEKTVEVIIGTPDTRGDLYKVDGHQFGYNGYSITAVGTKVLILAGSAEALVEAIEVFETDILKITKKTKKLADCTLNEKNAVTEMPDNYTIETVTLAGNNLKDYVIAVDTSLYFNDTKKTPKQVAEGIQDLLYKNIGIWLPIVDINTEYGKGIVINIVDPKLASKEGFVIEVKNGNLNIECGFPNKLDEAAMGFFRSEITNKKVPNLVFNENYTSKINVRDIKYSDKVVYDGIEGGGALGDGINDDFIEMRHIHLYANRWGHTVNAVIGKTYYIGFEFAKDDLTIPVKTDVNLEGAKFIFDDTVVPVEYLKHYESTSKPGTCGRCGAAKANWETTNCNYYSNGWHSLPIFDVVSDYKTKSYNATQCKEYFPNGLRAGATNIGWEPGELTLIKVYNSNIKHYIRQGTNANSGKSQQEILLVYPDGSIDPSTPVQWDYEVVTSMDAKCVEDDPITISGGIFTTKANLGPNYYYSYGRNFIITRANVTIQNMEHYMDENKTHGRDDPSIERCPYKGFIRSDFTNNTTVKNVLVTHHTPRYDKGSGASLGTYEFGANSSNDLKWIGCTQSNFFNEDGSVSYKGLFGSNYCKNFYFEGCNITSMDAHSGLYNATIIDSTFEHMNFIGAGDIYIKNVIVYVDGNNSAVNLRTDYGSTWTGNLTIDGMDMRYAKSHSRLSLIHASWTDAWFGYEINQPETIKINNLKLTKFTYSYDADGKRTETTVADPNLDFYLFTDKSFYNTTGNFSLWKDPSKNPNGETNGVGVNTILHGTKKIEMTNCGSLRLIIPNNATYENLEYYIDGVLYDWKNNQ